MKTILLFCVIIVTSPLLVSAFGHGIGSETLPPQMIGIYNSTIYLQSWPNTAEEDTSDKQISLTIYDVETEEHLHNMKIDFAISKHGELLFSNDFDIDEGTFTLIFSDIENLSIDEKLEKLFDNIVEYGSNQIPVNENIFSEGGLYDFDIAVNSVDSFNNILEEPVLFKGALSIPKKYNYDTEYDNSVSVTTYYDVIESFSFSSDLIKFSMPFEWSDDIISQTSVIHEEIHIPKSMSTWITNDYDLMINDIPAPDSLITIDDYSIENERIIHIILPQLFIPDYAIDLQQMNFELTPSSSPNFPLVSRTGNNEFDVNLTWEPENPVWGKPVNFEIKIVETFVPSTVAKKIPFDVSLVQDDMILFEKRINGVKNVESPLNSFEFMFDESQTGSVQLLIDNIDSNPYAETEFVFVVNSPLKKFPITIPSQTVTGDEGSYDVDVTWIPADILPDTESEFIFTIYEKDSKIPIYNAYYEFVLIKDDEEIFRNSQIAPAGGSYEDFVFAEEHTGSVLVKLDKINNTDEFVEITVNVVPEFGVVAILVLIISFTIMMLFSKKMEMSL